MRQHNIWCVCMCSIWKGMPKPIVFYPLCTTGLGLVIQRKRKHSPRSRNQTLFILQLLMKLTMATKQAMYV